MQGLRYRAAGGLEPHIEAVAAGMLHGLIRGQGHAADARVNGQAFHEGVSSLPGAPQADADAGQFQPRLGDDVAA